MPLKKLRKKIKKWLPLVIAIIQLATAVITAINKE
nr:MAG TPA: SurA N-terminal domain [Caudoviricetes sp.]DAN15141.1 MAG TPA: SurA N-terminal domain [Caudoviricetes sp.]DAT20847.1 MAG TPA: SurA N-terminal domain [Caudoviricetes sp.]